MRWRYKPYRNYKRSNQPKFFFSEKEIDFTNEYLDFSQFLLQEFFTANLETRRKVSNYYIQEFGSRSLAYLNRKYFEWAKGDYHLTDMMRERIISIMPQFLSQDAKYKLGIHEFMASIKNTVKSFQSIQKNTYRNKTNLRRLEEVGLFFENEYEKIQALTIGDIKFNILTEEEKEEALEISKYILAIKLQKAFDQIERDFNIFIPYVGNNKRGILSANYSITLFNSNVDISNKVVEDIKLPTFSTMEIEADSRYKEYSDKYLAYELLSIHSEANKAVSNSFLNDIDIQLFLTHYEELSKGDSEVSMKSTFQGEGGTLMLMAQVIPLKLLKSSIVVSSVKLVIYLIVILIIASLEINHKLFTSNIIASLLFGIIALSFINEEIKKLKSLTKEFKTYGQ